MGQYNLMFEQEEFTELVRLYSELAKIADRQMNEYQMILDIINTNAVISGELHDKLEVRGCCSYISEYTGRILQGNVKKT